MDNFFERTRAMYGRQRQALSALIGLGKTDASRENRMDYPEPNATLQAIQIWAPRQPAFEPAAN